jgi:hypothetical protein
MSDNRMNEWLGAVREDVSQHRPDPLVETQLLARVRERGALRAVRAATRPAPEARSPWWVRLALVVPAGCAAALVVLLGTRSAMPVDESIPAMRAVATPFIALVAPDTIAAERAPVVVASQVARSALADYGLPVDPSRADEPVGAEFLMSRAGVVLAVRFID